MAADPEELKARGRSFGAVTTGYAALRPSYPTDAVAFLLGEPGRPRQVLADRPDTRGRQELDLP